MISVFGFLSLLVGLLVVFFGAATLTRFSQNLISWFLRLLLVLMGFGLQLLVLHFYGGIILTIGNIVLSLALFILGIAAGEYWRKQDLQLPTPQ